MKSKAAYWLAVLAAIHHPAFAQPGENEGAAKENVLDEIIILSSPLRSKIDEISLGVTVLGSDDLISELDGTIGQTLARQPGVSSTFFGPGASRPVIRGLGGERIRVLISDISTFDVSTTSVDHIVATSIENAEQVEILRGAATLRFGQNAIGGVVNVYDSRIPRTKPEDGFDLLATSAYSSVDDGFQIAGNSQIALPGSFVAHIDGSFRETQDYEIPGFAVDNPGPTVEEGIVDNSDTRVATGTGGLSYVFDDGYIGASVTYQDGIYGVPEPVEELDTAIDFEQVRLDFDAEIERDFLFLQRAKVRFGYADYEHSEGDIFGIGTVFENDAWEGRAEGFLQSFNLGPGEITGTFGATVADREFSALGAEAFVPLNTQFNWGLFALSRYTVRDLIFELSGRVDRQSNETEDLFLQGADLSADINRTTFSVSASAIWEPLDGLSFGLNLSSAERAPVAEELFSGGFHVATSSFEVGDPTLDTERARTAELSAKWSWDPFSIGFNVFYTDYSDFISEVPTGAIVDDGEGELFPVFFFQQADAEIYGFEAELDWLIHDGKALRWAVDGQADLVRGQTLEDSSLLDIAVEIEGGFGSPFPFTGLIGDGTVALEGSDLPFFPPFRVLFGTDLEVKNLNSTLRIEVQHSASQRRVPENLPETDSFTFLNVAYTMQPLGDDRMTVFVRGRNLTDEFARLSTAFLSPIAPLPGRDIRVGATIRF
ncbi:MAG: TonB-dependent receptor [Pseudomonadota bacterium]